MSITRLSGEEAVKIIGQNEFLGNIIPKNWYKNIRLSNGKPNLTAITILSEIVYWYRPSKDGGKKFAEDIWQCNYKYFEEEFGLSRKQILTALESLEELGLVYRELRCIKARGRNINNFLYIGLNADKLIEISGDTLSTSMETGCDIKEESISTCKVTPISAKVKTNTKNTTKNPKEITSEISQPPILTSRTEDYNIKEVVGYDHLKYNLSKDGKDILEDMIEVIEDVLSQSNGVYRINKQSVGVSEVQRMFRNLREDHLEYVIGYMLEEKINATNKKAYLVAMLFNAVKNKNTKWQSKKKQNSFHNFEQREYDFAEIEKQLLAR